MLGLRLLFENDRLDARIGGGNGRAAAGSAKADDHDVGMMFNRGL